MNKLQNSAALKDLKLLSQPQAIWKLKNMSLEKKSILWWKAARAVSLQCWELNLCPCGRYSRAARTDAGGKCCTNFETWKWTPETLGQYPSLSCCQVFCHPEGDSGNLKGWRFQRIFTSANHISEAASTFNSQKFLIYLPTLAPFSGFPQWEYENITWL